MNALADCLLAAVRLGDAAADSAGRERWPGGPALALLPDLAAFEGVTPWLYERLKLRQELPQLPETVVGRLREAALQAAARNLGVDQEAAGTIDVLQGAGIPVILLKGVARRALGGHRYHALRPTADVDLLLPQAHAGAAFELLTRHGYESATTLSALRPRHHHLPPLWTERRVCVELHVSLSPLVEPALAWSRTRTGARAVQWQGLRVLVPSRTELAWSTVVHAPTNGTTLGFRLRDFLDFAVLLEEEAQPDWKLLAERTSLGEAADGDSGQPVPSRVLASWLAAARSLGTASPGTEAPEHGFDFRLLLSWRLRILASHQLRPGVADRLLGESARVVAGLPPQRPPWWVEPPAYRWRLLGRVTRTAFRAWRAVARPGRAA